MFRLAARSVVRAYTTAETNNNENYRRITCLLHDLKNTPNMPEEAVKLVDELKYAVEEEVYNLENQVKSVERVSNRKTVALAFCLLPRLLPKKRKTDSKTP